MNLARTLARVALADPRRPALYEGSHMRQRVVKFDQKNLAAYAATEKDSAAAFAAILFLFICPQVYTCGYMLTPHSRLNLCTHFI